jgi:gluconate 2-dehydrogenase gamma chain
LDPVKPTTLNRRSLLLGAVFLVGGAAALTQFVRRPDGGSRGPVLSADQFALLEQMVDTMIPATDTPGAIDAGVPAFLRDMLREWASEATRAEFTGVLDAVQKQSFSKFGADFRELPAERRLEAMREFDGAAIKSGDAAYGKFKYLVLLAYYQSEVGATQELRYELVPGAWRSCLPLTEVGRASAV